jgi:hypothetical protein
MDFRGGNMKITEDLLSLNKKARSGQKFNRTLQRIIVHWIGPYANQAVSTPRNWWENGSDKRGVQASAHFILKDEDVLQCVPLDEIALHSGDARNNDSIGIEIIPMNNAGEFSETTIKTLKELIAYIREKTGISLPIERHYDGVQKKDCPRFYTPVTNLIGTEGRLANPEGGEGRWNALRAYLDGELEVL